jgi:7-cyano-7-deazaguanine synthase in queuosine biosynthesis
MVDGPTVVLNGGGLRSIVATAVAITDTEAREIVVVHLRDGRPNAAVRADHVRRQARHFDISRVIELDLPHLQTTLRPAANEDKSISPLTRPQMVLAALGQAIRLRACHLIWPIQINADFDAASRLTEQVVLIEHLAQLEQEQSTSIRMPLLELTDQQLIELGTQLEVPWSLAWTCAFGRNEPCATCPPCRQRHAAFEAAGIVDPSAQQPVAERTG